MGRFLEEMGNSLMTSFILTIIGIVLFIVLVGIALFYFIFNTAWDKREKRRRQRDLEILYPEGYRKVGADSEAVEGNWDEIDAFARQANAENNGTAPKENVWKKNKKFLIAIASIVLVGIIVGIIMNLPPGSADIKSAEVGDRVSFGNYKGSNGWIVLDKQDDKLLILSENAICDKEFNEERETVTWSTCSLRTWLNTEYLKQAFSERELESIADTSVYTEPSPGWRSPVGENAYVDRLRSSEGENTIDKVFLLSVEEAEKYFSNDEERKTTTAKGENCWWWLRTTSTDCRATLVYYSGDIDYLGGEVNFEKFSVRPALWIDLKTR